MERDNHAAAGTLVPTSISEHGGSNLGGTLQPIGSFYRPASAVAADRGVPVLRPVVMQYSYIPFGSDRTEYRHV